MDRKRYTLLLYLLFPIIWTYFVWRGFKDRRYLQNIKQRLGLFKSKIAVDGLHFHCASMGEMLAAIPLISQITKKHPELSITITSTTPTGKAEADKLIQKLHLSNIQHCYLPIDWPGACRRFIKNVQPKFSILMETELWPNLLNQFAKKKIPVLLANARLSDTSFKKYHKHPKLSQEIFSNIAWISAQYQSDSLNFQKLGACEKQIECVGNIKFDLKLEQELIERQKELKQKWSSNRPSWIAASIHPAEFKMILNIHRRLLKTFSKLLLIAVPRHPERFDGLKKECENAEFNFVSRSENISPSENESIVVGDTMGELLLMYGASDIAFVGGSLIPRGGHNPIEPAACGLPVIIGRNHFNFSDVCEKMKEQHALDIINDEEDLYQKLKQLLSNPERLVDRKNKSKEMVKSNQGAIDKISDRISKLINK